MEWTPRRHPPARTLATGALLVALLGCPSSASAVPRLLSVRLDPGAVAGRSSTLLVAARDERSPVGGMVVRLGNGELYATSACRAPDSGGRQPGAPFAPGSRARLAAPLYFDRAGALDGLIRVDGAGCGAASGSVFQPFTADPVSPGDRPRPLVTGVTVPAPPGLPLPALPGVGSLPVLPLSGPAAVDATSRTCPGAHRRPGRSRRARAQANKALLCLINRIRRHHGLRALRRSRKLQRAAYRHSLSMVRRHYFSHVQPGGIDLVHRLRTVHYLPASRWLVGENLAAGTGRLSTPAVQLRGWMRSPGHRANLLNRRFRDIGLGITRGVPSSRRRGGTYTSDFGFRR